MALYDPQSKFFRRTEFSHKKNTQVIDGFCRVVEDQKRIEVNLKAIKNDPQTTTAA